CDVRWTPSHSSATRQRVWVAGALRGIMPKHRRGPRSSRRRLYAKRSRLDLFLWCSSMEWRQQKTHDYGPSGGVDSSTCLLACDLRRFLQHSQEGLLRSCQHSPLELLIDECSRMVSSPPSKNSLGVKNELGTIEKQWQAEWARSTKSRWTHRLIPNIIPWIERRHWRVRITTYHAAS
ncbi:unnamed protein product, partial [Trichogramma brassicae]